ncbi:MAG: hypothetical protein ABSB30_07785 [Terracidiphilus sp.]
MIERVVENWLINANERQYQIPFCQVLAAEGETVKYISPHGVMEQGKDVITEGTDGSIRAYQLKNGKITLKKWREFKGEIDELVELPISHPSVHSKKPHQPFLVTNGIVADTVITRIDSANKIWKKHNPKALRLIQGNELISRFVKAHGSFMPRHPKQFGKFLELIAGAGRDPFDKEKFSSFLESILTIEGKGIVSGREAARLISSAVLLTSIIVQGCEREDNHWAVFEAWTVTASYILAIASKNAITEKWWSVSFDLCETAATRALEGLCTECAENKTHFTQGDPFTDGTFTPMRVIVIAGTLSALSLYHRLRREQWKGESFLQDFLVRYLPNNGIWGESAAPYITMAALELEQHGIHTSSERLIGQFLNMILKINEVKGRGLPNTYYEPESAYRLLSGMDRYNSEIFYGSSYVAESLVEFLARRLLRRMIAYFWESITHIDFVWFRPEMDWEWFRWRAESGSLESRMPNMPQSWTALLDAAENGKPDVPELLRARPWFAPLFCIVFPHRFGVGLLRLIECSIREIR